MKKGFALILMIIVALAVFVPCCTTDNCEADQTTTANTKDHPLKQAGTCSPFFSCSSCAGFALTVKAVQVATLPAPTLEHHEHKSSFAPSSYVRSLLQPPKFSI